MGAGVRRRRASATPAATPPICWPHRQGIGQPSPPCLADALPCVVAVPAAEIPFQVGWATSSAVPCMAVGSTARGLLRRG
eukprot:1186855-Alexandrium_andersonii.AAC.1